MPDPSSPRKGSPADWDSEKTAPKGESADEKLRRLQMQMASGSRSGVRVATSAAPPTRPGRRIGEIVLITFAAIAILSGLVVAAIAVLNKPADENTPAVGASSPLEPADTSTGSGEDEAKDYRWLKSDADEAKPYTDLLDEFFAADLEAKKSYFEPSPTLETRLDQYRDSPLLEALPPQRYAKNIFITDDGIVSIDTNITGHGFRPIVLLPSQDGSLKIDFDSYIGHNDLEWSSLLSVLSEKKSLRIRALIQIDRSMTAKVPGDVILEFRNPDLEDTYHAHLSILDVPEKHIVRWLNAGVPLPFTITLAEEDSLYGKILRVQKVEANAWLIDDRGRSLAIAP